MLTAAIMHGVGSEFTEQEAEIINKRKFHKQVSDKFCYADGIAKTAEAVEIVPHKVEQESN